MAKKMGNIAEKFRRVFSANFFFWLILAVFILEAVWFAVSARYPMAFDENYHFGLIKLYSHQLSPFIRHEPAGASVFGDVTRYPSYLFHYLLSFVYRLIELVTKNTADQIVALRLINVGLFASGLVLWKKVFRSIGVSEVLGNLALLVLILLPQIPFLAGQINYDNLLFPLVAGAVWLTVIISAEWQEKKLATVELAGLLALGLLASLVKYTFLPIFLAILGYLTVKIWPRRAGFWIALKQGWRPVPAIVKAILVIGVVLSFGLFTERYGYNLAHYHTLVPDCSRVIGTDPCLDYGPWARNFHYATARTDQFNGNVIKFTSVWVWRMWQQPFFVIRQDYVTGQAFLLPELTAGAVLSVGLVALIIFWRRLKARPYFGLLATVTLLYTAGLWLLNFAEYRHFQQYVAIQVRYLFPILPMLFVLLGWAISELVRSSKAKVFIAIIALLLLLQGGGVLNYLATTDPSWWWPNTSVIGLNQTAQNIVRPFLLRSLTIKSK